MSAENLCSFCESLTVKPRRGWGGTANKCPLCKQEQWAAPNGTTYRLDASLPNPSNHHRWMFAAGLLAAACLVVVITLYALQRPQAPIAAAAVAPAPVVAESVDPNTDPTVGPSAEAKRGSQPYEARAKPSRQVDGKKPPLVAAAPVVPEKPKAIAKGAGATPRTPVTPTYYDVAEQLESQLRTIPEVDFDRDYLKRSKKEIADKAKEIAVENKKDKDAFIQKLIKDRPDLEGMPFLLGKDCAAPAAEAKGLATRSILIREALGDAQRTMSRSSMNKHVSQEFNLASAHFWQILTSHRSGIDWKKPESIPALQQILTAEDRSYRESLTGHFNGIKGSKATEALANRAIFDLDPDVRRTAIGYLHLRPKEEYRPALLKGLRYPWAAAARNAAQAIAVLELRELVPDLVSMLDEPVPTAPFAVDGKDGKKKIMVRELVRVNHHRNCMLCHATVDTSDKKAVAELRNIPVGPAPTPGVALPPSASAIYYAPRDGITLVRADITYLRQDFSVRLKVDAPGKWSEMQRYDFFVRTRALTDKELDKRPPPADAAEFKAALNDALTLLTGRQVAPTAQAWREVLAMPEPGPAAKAKGTR